MKGRFYFSKAEKVGVAVLSLIIVGLLVLLNIPRHSFVPDLLVTDTTDIEYIYPEKRVFKKKEEVKKKYSQKKIKYKAFNPNKYSEQQWERIGFSQKQAAVILNYKKQIDGFKTPADIANCFVVSDEKFTELEPYLRFERHNEVELITEVIPEPILIVELNEADQEALKSVKGIGPFFAEKIIELREKLGGYSSVPQIKEVYGMTDKNYEIIASQLSVKGSLVRPINLSKASFDQLKKHPYLNWKQSQVLMSVPNKIVTDELWSGLLNSEAFSESDINRLKPYLK